MNLFLFRHLFREQNISTTLKKNQLDYSPAIHSELARTVGETMGAFLFVPQAPDVQRATLLFVETHHIPLSNRWILHLNLVRGCKFC